MCSTSRRVSQPVPEKDVTITPPITLPQEADTLAPDLSEIRLLPAMSRGGMVHCVLNTGGVSLAVAHKTIEEIWFCLSGEGEVWRKLGDEERCDPIRAGVSLTIPTGAHFQFRNTGGERLCLIIVTMPPWPGAEEAYRVSDHWPVI